MTKMLCSVILLGLVALGLAQYQNTGAYHPQSHHQSAGSGSSSAPVHYVNIGAQLQGDYKFGYNTGNGGSFREETRNPDGSVSGAYGYIDGSGQQKVIRYTAGKEGFKAEGDDIPKAPPAPQPAAPHAAAPAYHQPAPSTYNPHQSYNAQPAPAYHNNYIQPQPSHGYSQYSAPQSYGGQSQGSYNPFAYIGHQGSAAGQPPSNHVRQLSYNIGTGGGSQGYQG